MKSTAEELLKSHTGESKNTKEMRPLQFSDERKPKAKNSSVRISIYKQKNPRAKLKQKDEQVKGLIASFEVQFRRKTKNQNLEMMTS